MATRKASGSDTLTIACKLPQGLHIHLPDRKVLKLHGSASPFAIAGHGMTRGITVDQWAAVETIYCDAAWLKNEAVFAMKREEDASDKAVDLKGENRGFEPIDQANPNLPNISIAIEKA